MLILTPEKLRELDIISRTAAGVPVVVFPYDPRNYWGYFSSSATSFRNVPVQDCRKMGWNIEVDESTTHVNIDHTAIYTWLEPSSSTNQVLPLSNV